MCSGCSGDPEGRADGLPDGPGDAELRATSLAARLVAHQHALRDVEQALAAWREDERIRGERFKALVEDVLARFEALLDAIQADGGA